MRRPAKFRRQRPFAGGRPQLPSCVLPDLKRFVEKDAVRFNCSKSLVVASILAEFYGYKFQERFNEEPKEVPKK